VTDWGSVADWVSAIGGSAGAGTAATFYFLNRRRARITQKLEENRRAVFEAEVATQTYGVARNTLCVARKYLLSPQSDFGATLALRAQLASFAATATRLQQLPGLPVGRFMDLCDILEAITDRRIEGRGTESIIEAVDHLVQVADPLEQKLAKELGISLHHGAHVQSEKKGQ
jgi:hypothetical protein